MISVNATQEVRKIRNFWNNFHFHPTDAIEDDWGKRILDEAAKDNVADTVRMYAMLEDIVSMDADGNLHYDYTLNDQRLDYMISKGFDIFLSYNFLPPCLAEDAEEVSNVSKRPTRYKGKMIVTSAPRDYAQWEEICYQYTCHIVERYGIERVASWRLQCYNEPDHPSFLLKKAGGMWDTDATFERVKVYVGLYRGFSNAIRRVSEKLHAGGPASAGNLLFLEQFCKAVKKENLKLDFFTVHSYGTGPDMINSKVKLLDAEGIFQTVTDYFRTIQEHFGNEKEVILDEWGASYCGFYNREECPQLMFREGSEYAAYFGKLITQLVEREIPLDKMIICLSGQHEMEVDFSGFRNFITMNFIKKPIYNAYILSRKIGNTLLASEHNVGELEVLATKDGGRVNVLLSYAARHFDRMLPDLGENVKVSGMTPGAHNVTVWYIDENHTNPYKYALRAGFGDTTYTEEQLVVLREKGCLKPVFCGTVTTDDNGDVTIPVGCSCNAMVSVDIE